jgi:hypothetical protein
MAAAAMAAISAAYHNVAARLFALGTPKTSRFRKLHFTRKSVVFGYTYCVNQLQLTMRSHAVSC